MGYSERVAVLKFGVTPEKTLTLVQIYAPTSAHADDDVEEFYNLVNRAACDENRRTWNMIIGDFNAKVGLGHERDNVEIVGNFGLGERNERGNRLTQFAFGKNMHFCNTFFMKKAQRRWTWVSPDGITRHEIDYILSSDNYIIKNISVINKIKFSSDHRPIRAKIRFDFKIHRAKLFRKQSKKLSKDTLINNSECFNLELSNYFKELKIDETDATDQYHAIVTGINNSYKAIKSSQTNKITKLTSHTIDLINKRTKKDIGTAEYRILDREVKRSIRKDLRNINTHLVKTALEKHSSLRVLKQGITKGKAWINSLVDNSGTKHYNREKVLEIATTFYKSLYSDNRIPDNLVYNTSDSVPPINGYEVHKALTTMYFNKSPGEDGITTEALKIGSHTLLPHLTNLFNSIMQSGQVPSEMCHSNIVLLHKKGDKSDISNYRPISLTSHVYKAFIKVIHNRIYAKLDQHQPPEQAGFRPSFSTTDHLQTLNQIVEKYSEFKKPLYLAFVDYTKAFDSIKHSEIFTSLENQNLDEQYIHLLRKIYANSTANIKLDITGPTFKIEKGVKQGDPLSPKLFTSTLEEIFKTLAASWQTKGIEIGNKRLTNLRFADDIVLFAHNALELQTMLQDLNAASLKVGLAMNRSKTKIMSNNTKHRVEVDGQEIQYFARDRDLK